MRKIYEKPSMAMNLFDTVDMTNVTVKSTVATKGTGFDRIGINIIDSTGFNLHS